MKQQTVRKQIADLIREMRSVPECIPKYKYLSRDWVTAEETFSIECESFSSIEERVKEFCRQNNVEQDSVSLSTTTVKVPYEDYAEQALTLYVTVPESDLQYLARIETIYRDWLNKLYAPITDSEWASLYHRINRKFYLARNVTRNFDEIEECLSALELVYDCMNYEESSDADMRRKQKEAYEQLNKQF